MVRMCGFSNEGEERQRTLGGRGTREIHLAWLAIPRHVTVK